MKGLFLNTCTEYYGYYKFPDGFDTVEQLVEYFDKHFNSFIALTYLDTENCRSPYFIEEETHLKYVNISKITSLREVEITILSKQEYEERLKKIVETKCVHCESYEEETDPDGDNLSGHRTNINLDGECYGYTKKD